MWEGGNIITVDRREEIERLAKQAFSQGWKLGEFGASRVIRHIHMPFQTTEELQEKFIENKLLDRRLTAADSSYILGQIERGFRAGSEDAFRSEGRKGKKRIKMQQVPA